VPVALFALGVVVLAAMSIAALSMAYFPLDVAIARSPRVPSGLA
jgi:hypothetical protein